ncbi:hypothetical protein D3C86_2093100 [compost metagenome]
MLLQALHGAAHGGLGHAQLLGGAAKAALAADREKRMQLDQGGGVDFHGGG